MQVERVGTGVPLQGTGPAAGQGSAEAAQQASQPRRPPGWSEGPQPDSEDGPIPPRLATVDGELHWTVQLQQFLTEAYASVETLCGQVVETVETACTKLGLGGGGLGEGGSAGAAAQADEAAPAEPDPALRDAPALDALIDAVAFTLAQWSADGPAFDALLLQRFGPDRDPAALAALREACRTGDWSGAPAIVLVDGAPADVDGGAEAGPPACRYDAASDRILLSRTLLHDDPDAAQQAVIAALAEAVDLRLPRAAGVGSGGKEAPFGPEPDHAPAAAPKLRPASDTGTASGGEPPPEGARGGGATPGASPRVPVSTPLALGNAVHPDWLQQRHGLLDTLHAEHHAAHRAALDHGPGAPGWRVFTPHWMDGPSGPVPLGPQGQSLVWVPAVPGAQGVQSATDPGAWWGFCDADFAAHRQATMQAAPSATLVQLAALYDTPAETLFSQRPDLWALIVQDDRPLNAGEPPVPGLAMGDATTLGLLDLYLADPLNQQLIAAYGGEVAEPTSPLALEQVRLYGRDRWTQLTRLDQAHAAVRGSYAEAMAQARDTGGIGWVEVPMQIGVHPETGEPVWALRADDAGQVTVATARVFSPEVFTDAWLAQGGLAQEAFGITYGRVQTQIVRTQEAADSSHGFVWVAQSTVTQPGWCVDEGGLSHAVLVPVDLNAPPRLYSSAGVGFDAELGWSTPAGNLRDKPKVLQQAAAIAVVAAVSYFTAGATAHLGAVVSGAAAGAAASLASGTIAGEVSLKSVLQGALGGALTAGILQGSVGTAVRAAAGPMGSALLLGTVQGTLQSLLGGEFKDGFVAGVASSLASAIGEDFALHIGSAVQAGAMSASEATAARFMGRVLCSAVRALGDPGHPGHAFARELLGQWVKEGAEVVLGEVRSTQALAASNAVDSGAGGAIDGTGPAEAVVATDDAGTAGPASGTQLRTGQVAIRDAGDQFQHQGGWINGEWAWSFSIDEGGLVEFKLREDLALVRQPSGELQLMTRPHAQSLGLTVLVHGGQTLSGDAVSGQALLFEATAPPIERQLATVLALPLAGGAVPGWLGVQAGSTVSALALDASWAMRAAGVLGLALVPSSLGGGVTIEPIDRHTRLVKSSGDVARGHLEVLVEDSNGQSQWHRLQGPTFTAGEVLQAQQTLRTTTLTPQDLQRLQGPLIYVPPPAQPSLQGLPGDTRIETTIPGSAPDIDPWWTRLGTPGYQANPTEWADTILTRDQTAQADFRRSVIADHMASNPEFPRELLPHYDAHHILPLNEYPDLQGLRDKFIEWGIDLNDPVNGVLLPRIEGLGAGTLHRDTQGNLGYQREIWKRFADVTTGSRAIQVLAEIKSDLQQGTFIPPKVRP